MTGGVGMAVTTTEAAWANKGLPGQVGGCLESGGAAWESPIPPRDRRGVGGAGSKRCTHDNDQQQDEANDGDDKGCRD